MHKTAFWYSWKTGEEVTEWYESMNTSWREWHSAYTCSFTNPLKLLEGKSVSQSAEEVFSRWDCDE